jgi:hypothetical protein
MVIFHKVPNMSKDMFIKNRNKIKINKNNKFPMDGFLGNEPVLDEFTLDGF